MKPIKIAILSLTHGHSRKYFQALKENQNLEWVAAYAETKKIKNAFLKTVHDIPCYTNEQEMFEQHPEIEAVIMASSNREHLHQFKTCTDRKIHILSMKIPSFDMDEYAEISKMVERSGVVCQIELELHYNPVMYRVKQLICDDELGKIHTINATNITLSPIWAFPWQGDPEESYGKRIPLAPGDNRFRGGSLADHPHLFDLIRTLTGSEIHCVYAEAGQNIRKDIEVEDNLLINGKMKNGVSFLFDPSWSRMEERLEIPGPGWEVFPKRMEVNVNISGEKGVVMADFFGPNVYHNGAPNDMYTVQYTYFDEWIGMMDEFVDCIRNHTTPQINLKWHKETIKAINACYDSIASGSIVYL
jgi:predicted dehydrogenase